MHFSRCDADLCTHAEFTAIRKLSGRVVHHYRGINLVEERFRGRCIFSNDRVRMFRRVAVNESDCFRQIFNRLHRQNSVQIFRIPIQFRCCLDALVATLSYFIAANFATRQSGDQSG